MIAERTSIHRIYIDQISESESKHNTIEGERDRERFRRRVLSLQPAGTEFCSGDCPVLHQLCSAYYECRGGGGSLFCEQRKKVLLQENELQCRGLSRVRERKRCSFVQG